MPQMPEIKGEVNKEPERDKKKAGLLARLFGGGGGGGGAALGGLGAGGGLGSAAAGGGLLATKAGLMALILVGTTVAGGIGLVGYRVFGPGQDQGNGDNLQLFAPKPKEAASADAQGASKDGSSQSLTFLSQANSQGKAAEAAPAEATKDETAASAASAGASAAKGGSNGPINSMDHADRAVSKNLLKGGGKFGSLSSAFGGGGGRGSSASVPANHSGGAESMASASHGGASGFGKGRAAAGGARSIAGRRAGRALTQAFGANRDGHSNPTSFANAGRTFDGSAATSGGTTGPEGGAIGAGGPGTADGGQPTNLPANASGDKKEFTAPPTPTSKDAAPWQNAINTAQMMLAAGALLLFLMGKVKVPWIRYAIGAVVLALGVAIVALGGKISGGEWGQKVQGNVLAAAGLGLSAAAVIAMMSVSDAKTKYPATGGNIDTAAEAKDSGLDILGGINPYVLLGGGAAVVAIATCQLKPPEKHPSSDFENGKPPDANWFGYQEFPSETAVKKMVA